jgi:hypothetical protein
MWPATAVALAADAGAARIGLLGIDLGTTDRPDPAFASLCGLLDVVRRFVPADAIDCGAPGARKPGWEVKALDVLALDRVLAPLAIRSRLAPSRDERFNTTRELRRRLEPVIHRARRILTIALQARNGGGSHRLEESVDELLGWCGDRSCRLDLQEGLGLSFLPRLWRIGIDAR